MKNIHLQNVVRNEYTWGLNLGGASADCHTIGYRFYSPEMGRWTTRDPLGEAGGVNLYAFVGNNPVNWVDPWGLYTEVVQWGRSPGRSGRWGHISGNITGQNWSFGPGGWETKYLNFSDYAARQAAPDIDRGGRGIVLDLSPAEEE